MCWQQLKFLGTKAKVFDPRNSKDIARKIIDILDNYEEAKKETEISKEEINKYTLKDFGQKYIDIFKKGARQL